MEIKASQVKELRDMTGVAMMDCKKALVDCEGDIEKALDLLRSNSALKAEKNHRELQRMEYWFLLKQMIMQLF